MKARRNSAGTSLWTSTPKDSGSTRTSATSVTDVLLTLGLLSLLGCGYGVGVSFEPTASATRVATFPGSSLLIHAAAEDGESRVHFSVDDVYRIERIGGNSSMRLLSPENAAQYLPFGAMGFEDGMAHVSAQRPDDVPLIFRVRAWTTPRGESWPESPPVIARYCLGD